MTPATDPSVPVMPLPSPITVSLIEDDRLTRESLTAWVQAQPELRLKSWFPNASLALQALPAALPNVVLVDLHLPGLSGIECVRQLRARHPNLKLVMLTIYEDADHIFEALTAGAHGYVLKRRFADELLPALRMVLEGGAPLSSEVAARVVAFFNQRGHHADAIRQLSSRQLQILENLSHGLSYKEIADEIGISVQTVNWHIKQVYDKLQVHSRSQAVAKFLNRWGHA